MHEVENMNKKLFTLLALASITLVGCKNKDNSSTDSEGSSESSGGEAASKYEVDKTTFDGLINSGVGLFKDNFSFTATIEEDEYPGEPTIVKYQNHNISADYNNGNVQVLEALETKDTYNMYYSEDYGETFENYGPVEYLQEDLYYYVDVLAVDFDASKYVESEHAYVYPSVTIESYTYTNIKFYFEDNMLIKSEYTDDEGSKTVTSLSKFNETTVVIPSGPGVNYEVSKTVWDAIFEEDSLFETSFTIEETIGSETTLIEYDGSIRVTYPAGGGISLFVANPGEDGNTHDQYFYYSESGWLDQGRRNLTLDDMKDFYYYIKNTYNANAYDAEEHCYKFDSCTVGSYTYTDVKYFFENGILVKTECTTGSDQKIVDEYKKIGSTVVDITHE